MATDPLSSKALPLIVLDGLKILLHLVIYLVLNTCSKYLHGLMENGRRVLQQLFLLWPT